MIDRGDAVNLARDYLDREPPLTPRGVRMLADAVLAMDEYIRSHEALDEGGVRNARRWVFYASSPQTALMLGTKLDPNDNSVDWVKECNRLADAAMRRTK